MDLDYKKLGLKVGLEIHQQLDTHKLFCQCESSLAGEMDYSHSFTRKLRPTQSEMGDVDIAALAEYRKGKGFLYATSNRSTCLVEMDEEPPHSANEEAIDITILMALMLGSRIVDEPQFMRKIVIDGSNTSGFQRTALVSLGGSVDGIGIEIICLEEDAARKIGEKENFVNYGLDRLGIPLIEISTKPEIDSPERAKEIAARIGSLLRSTKKVKRGIGTIRQDLNVSIDRGARVEIKGVQRLNDIPIIIENEVIRQLNLVELKEKLSQRNCEKFKAEMVDVTDLMDEKISEGEIAIASLLPNFSGLIGDGLGKEFESIAKVEGGKIITDIGEKTKISKEIKERLECSDKDAFVISIGKREIAKKVLKSVVDRALAAMDGVPREVRKALLDGTTEYMRPMPGAARLYPETDIPPIQITKERIDRIRENLPELPEDKMIRFRSDYGLSEEQARQLISSGKESVFDSLAKKYPPTIVARIYLNICPEIEREGFFVNDESIEKLLEAFNEGKFAKEAFPKLLKYYSKNPAATISEALIACEIESIGKREVKVAIKKLVQQKKEIIREKGMGSFGMLMGIAMKDLRGKADGSIVSDLLKEEIERILKNKNNRKF